MEHPDHRFDPRRLGRLDHPLRKLMMPPRRTLRRIGVASGEVLLDVGAGSGYFSIPAAGMVGPLGRVYAVDVAGAAVAMIREKAAALGLANLEARLSVGDQLGIAPGSATIALLSTVLHEVEDKGALLVAIRGVLKESGRLAVIEFKKGGFVPGPPDSARIAKDELRALLAASGFVGTVFKDLNPWMYLAIANH